ncbi:GSCFA domain-containing protein [Prevotella aurantiaca]|uniref:GSCFA domain-containing protein n=1 Tax=Prevotella aurantiaca TaxID=596085 RepID=UPI00288BE48B|nr:GSCFA domain-containing protein [Prevotella aurantiaca]
MEFRTIVNVPKPPFEIAPCERVLFIGSCFANNIGAKFVDWKFRTLVNPFGVMYNPASILHTIERRSEIFDTAFITLGTNHVYIEKATRNIVDNCNKRPQRLFDEQELSIADCKNYLSRAIDLLRGRNHNVKIIFTVSPIRYAKYGFHESQLSKATLLLAVHEVMAEYTDSNVAYFPAYEIVNDELRDYRFYKSDMLHPNEQAVEYIWERLVDVYFSASAKEFLRDWKPVKEALSHHPFNPDGNEYKEFMERTIERAKLLEQKYDNLIVEDQ